MGHSANEISSTRTPRASGSASTRPTLLSTKAVGMRCMVATNPAMPSAVAGIASAGGTRW